MIGVQRQGEDVHLNVAPNVGMAGDAVRLRQALAGLLHNAVKFTPAGGRVTVSALARGESLSLAISDTGVGMRQEDVAVVTRPFHRLRSALDGQYQGAGLGLPFARRIMELHGGSLSIESVPNRGTAVAITLPLLSGVHAEAA